MTAPRQMAPWKRTSTPLALSGICQSADGIGPSNDRDIKEHLDVIGGCLPTVGQIQSAMFYTSPFARKRAFTCLDDPEFFADLDETCAIATFISLLEGPLLAAISTGRRNT